MKGLYLYCLRKKNPASIKAAKTIDKGKVSLLPYKKLEAVVSEVDLKKFSSGEIQKRAQEDVNWIKEKALIHEHVIEQAMRTGEKIMPVIPMNFGIIFKTKKNIEEMLRKKYSKFKKTLKNLEGKQEWGVKVYLNEEVFTKHLQGGKLKDDWSSSLEVKKKKKEIASLPKGMDFFIKKQVEEMIKKEKNRKHKRVVQVVFENLERLACQVCQGKVLDHALTGRKEPMVLNANLLIEKEKVERFQKAVSKVKADYRNLGLIIQESGPWPPYNFVKI